MIHLAWPDLSDGQTSFSTLGGILEATKLVFDHPIEQTSWSLLQQLRHKMRQC